MPDPGAGRASEPALAPRSAGSLILSTTPAFATRWLIPRRGRFYAQYPDISLRLDTSTALIELHEDASVDLVIRYGTGESPQPAQPVPARRMLWRLRHPPQWWRGGGRNARTDCRSLAKLATLRTGLEGLAPANQKASQGACWCLTGRTSVWRGRIFNALRSRAGTASAGQSALRLAGARDWLGNGRWSGRQRLLMHVIGTTYTPDRQSSVIQRPATPPCQVQKKTGPHPKIWAGEALSGRR